MTDKRKDKQREKTPIPPPNADLDPFEIDFLPQFRKDRGPRGPFVNQYGAVIGDHDYESEKSPLQRWSKDTDPSVMSGDEWVHPFKDVGFHTAENKDYFEKGIPPQSGIYMHPDKDAAYEAYNRETGGALPDKSAGQPGQPGVRDEDAGNAGAGSTGTGNLPNRDEDGERDGK